MSQYIGFSSGCLYKIKGHQLEPEIIELYSSTAANAIEINIKKQEDLGHLFNSVSILKNGFQYCSLHLPSFIDKRDRDFFRRVNELNNSADFNLLVIHPSDYYDSVSDNFDFSSLEEVRNIPIGVENMDTRKMVGRDVESLQRIFNELDVFLNRPAGLVLDISHICEHDKTLKLGYKMKDEFQDRIIEFHLSGHTEHHDPLYKTEQYELLQLLTPGIPIIIESGLENGDELNSEIDWILHNTNY